MKSLWIIAYVALVMTSAGLGYMWRAESTRAETLQADVAKLMAERTSLSERASHAEEKAQVLESESAQLRAARSLSDGRLQAGPPAEAVAPPADAPAEEPAPPPRPRGNFLANMMKDPEMRKVIAAQQATALRGIYGPLLKDLHLMPDQSAQFYKILEERQMAAMDSGMKLLSGNKAAMQDSDSLTSTSDAAIKTLLSPEAYTLFQGYEKTLPQRIEVQQFNQDVSALDMPLQESQSAAIRDIMAQETASLPNLQSRSSSGLQTLLGMDQGQIDQYAQALDAANQRIYTRAASVLTPQQLAEFRQFQVKMTTAKKAGLRMTQQMFNQGQ